MTAIKNGTLLVKDSNGNTARVATLSQTDITTLNTALTDIEANKRKISSISANYVTTNTQQTITGAKIFTTKLRAPQYEIEPPTGSNNGGAIDFHFNGSTKDFTSRIIEDVDGRLNLVAKNGIVINDVPVDENSNRVPTTKWVNNKVNPISANYVTTNTVQDISAPKTFVGDGGNTINLVSNNIDYDNPPSTPTGGKAIFFSDKKNKNLGAIYSGVYSDSDGISVVFSRLQAHNDKNTTVPNAYLEVQATTWGTMVAYAPSNITHTNLAEIATTDWVNTKISTSGGSNPVGTIIPFAGSSIPAGYLLCNGATVSRTTYANLFGVISTLYGAGDGSTTFNLPDARGRFPEGANGNLGAYHAAGLPNIMGDWRSMYSSREDATTVGAAYFYFNDVAYLTALTAAPNNKGLTDMMFYADRSNAIYGASGTVQPASFCCQYLIKY